MLIWVGRLRAAFNDNFENNWFFILMEGIPLDPIVVKEIQDFLRIDEDWAVDEKRAIEGINNLDTFIDTVRKYLLPNIKERLRISNLKPENRVHDRDQVAIRRLVAYALPLKIQILDDLVREFKKKLNGVEEQPAPAVATASA